MKVALHLELDTALDIIQFSENDSLIEAARAAIIETVKDAEKRSSSSNHLRLISVKYDNRIQVIAVIRSNFGWGLKESNDCVKAVEAGQPQILPAMLYQDATAMYERLLSLGCVVEAA